MLSWLKVIKSLQLNHVPSSGGNHSQKNETVTVAKGTPPAYYFNTFDFSANGGYARHFCIEFMLPK